MTDTAPDLLLHNLGQRRKHTGLISDDMIRSKLLKLVGEDEIQRRPSTTDAVGDGEAAAKPELEPIDEAEQDMAWLQIRDLHPLSRTPLFRAYPFLCCCFKLCAKQLKPAVDKEAVRERINALNHHLDELIKHADGDKYTGTSFKRDMGLRFGVNLPAGQRKNTGKPGEDAMAASMNATQKGIGQLNSSLFAEYGFGIQAWIRMLLSLAGLYLFLSVCAVGMMMLYQGHHGLDESSSSGMFAKFNKYTLGNLGFAQSLCYFQSPLHKNEQDIQCAKGKLGPFQPHLSGAVSSKPNALLLQVDSDSDITGNIGNAVSDLTADKNNFVGHDFCGNPDLLPDDVNCLDFVNFDEMEKQYKKLCEGKKSCKMDLTDFMKQKSISPGTKEHQCHGGDNKRFTQLYLQVRCDIDDADLISAKQTSVIVVFIGMMMSSIFYLSVRYWQDIQDLEYKKWDIDTCTPADYTIKMSISKKQYQNYQDGLKNGSIKGELLDLIADELEKKIKELPHVFDSAASAEIRISAVTFGYRNGALIRALKTRGALVAGAQFHKVSQEDAKINNIIKHDFEKLREPVCAFITFNHQEAFERCEEYLFMRDMVGKKNEKYTPFNFLGEETKFIEAPEPSNVLWENLEVTASQRRGRKCGVSMVIVIFMIFTFVLFSYLKAKQGFNKLKYPDNQDCGSMQQLFFDPVTKEVNKDNFKEFAENDKEETVNNNRGAGYYMCYCKLYSKATDIAMSDDYKNELCYTYQYDIKLGFVLTNMVTILVTVTNIIIRTINIKLINVIGFSTKSEQVSLIMRSVFFATFINTGIIVLMTNADFENAPAPFNIIPIRSQYPDFNEQWYENIAPQLTQTMFIAAIYPYLEIIIFGSIMYLKVALDKSCKCCDKTKTKATTTQQFVNLYAGPEYLMHFKYSSILTQVWVSFMYGLFIPILFPIACLGIFNMYVVEKGALLWYYRKPPMYDNKLQRYALQYMKYAPFTMFVLAYWSHGNTGIFFNTVAVTTHYNAVPNPLHSLFNFIQLNQTHMIFIVGFIYFLLTIVKDKVLQGYAKLSSMCGKKTSVKDLLMDPNAEQIVDDNVRQKIGLFWDSLDGDEQKIWYASEIYSLFRFGINTVDTDALEQLRIRDRRKAPKIGEKRAKWIKGDCRYDILSNLNYQQEFQYIPIEQRNEIEDFELSDMILRALNLDQDNMSRGKEDLEIFKGSYDLLVSQAANTSVKNHKMHDKMVEHHHQEGDKYQRVANTIN